MYYYIFTNEKKGEEFIHPETRVVVDYKGLEDLILLGAVRN
jgi:hypothetical protein